MLCRYILMICMFNSLKKFSKKENLPSGQAYFLELLTEGI